MNRQRIEFLFLNVGHLYDHMFMLLFATVAALALAGEWQVAYADLLVLATPGFVAFGAFALPAGWLADPALHPALVELSASRIGDLGDEGYWEQVARAIGRCRPGAAAEAEAVEVTLLAATQASLVEVGALDVDVSLVGAYPATEVVVRLGDHERRHAIWNFDELEPDDPSSLDRSFALYRIAQLASWG